jgi:deoxyadenosine/deoxycytidine kinase
LDNIRDAQGSQLNVIDRSIFEDLLLFKLNADLDRATQTEVQIYGDLLNNIMEQVDFSDDAIVKTPDLLIYIHVSFDTMLERIKKRGREYEQIENDPSLYNYYKSLNERYVAWFESYDRSPKLSIDGDRFDFVTDAEAANQVLALIDDKIKALGLKNN